MWLLLNVSYHAYLTYYCFSTSWLTLNKVGKYPTDTFVEHQHDDNPGDAEIVTQF